VVVSIVAFIAGVMAGLVLGSVTTLVAGSSAHTPTANDSSAVTNHRNRPTLLIKRAKR
jgi:hypothetical protein